MNEIKRIEEYETGFVTAELDSLYLVLAQECTDLELDYELDVITLSHEGARNLRDYLNSLNL